MLVTLFTRFYIPSYVDKIDTVCVNTFFQSLHVTFIAIIDCGSHINNVYGNILYTWDFGNGNSTTTYLSSVTTVYQSNGTYSVSVVTSNNVSQAKYTGQINVESGMVINISRS